MSFIYPLCSSSKGNCTYVGTKENAVLIDAGVGIRNFATHLELIGVEKSAIKGIFITHEHSDHVKGLARIQKQLQIPVYASCGTLESLRKKSLVNEDMELLEISEAPMSIANMSICAFSTSHDSAQSQCYKIEFSDHKKLAICTDLGYVSEEIHSTLCDCDLVMLESNYEKTMLEIGQYPAFLKRRILGVKGHLSNDDCTAEIERLMDSGVKSFVLGHLSEENNYPELAYGSVLAALLSKGAVLNKDFWLSVAPKTNVGEIFEVV